MRSNNILYLKLVVFIFSFFLGCSSKVATQDVSFRVVPFSFTTDSGRYIMNGELKIPNHFSPTGKIVILVAPPSHAYSRSYLGFFDTLSTYLAINKIGVLRFDNRNYSQKNIPPNYLTLWDVAVDVHNAYCWLTADSMFSKSEIGILGHSESSFSVMAEASRNSSISFCILLSAPMISGEKLASYQAKEYIFNDTSLLSDDKQRLSEVHKNIFSIVKSETNIQTGIYKSILYLTDEYNRFPELKGKNRSFPSSVLANSYILNLLRPRIIQYIKFDPNDYLCHINSSLLLLYGKKDQIIPVDSSIYVADSLLRKICKKKNYKIEEFMHLDHNFQKFSEQKTNTYSRIDSLPVPLFELIKSWILDN